MASGRLLRRARLGRHQLFCRDRKPSRSRHFDHRGDVVKRDATLPPVQGAVGLQPKGTRELERPPEFRDEVSVIHDPSLCQPGIGHKAQCEARMSLDHRREVRHLAGMSAHIMNLSPEAYQRSIGERLRWVREAADHSQDEVAKLIGVDQAQWSRWEMGKRMPDPYKMAVFAARYRVSMGYIFQGSLLEVHPTLAEILRQAHPELRQATINTARDRGRLQDEYKAAIQQ